MKRVGVDVGGTFTDLILVDEETGRITVDKVPSTPDDPARGTVDGVQGLCARAGVALGELDGLPMLSFNRAPTDEVALLFKRAFDLMCGHAATREIAPGKPLGTKQMVQQWIAESRAEIDSARLLVLHAAWKIEREGAPAARQEISIIKFTVARTLQRVLDRAIQALGALGMTDDTPLAFWYAHERAGRIYDGADEVHIASVARRILARYAKGKARGDA